MDTLTFNAPILLRHLTFSEARKQPISEIDLSKALEGLEMSMSQVSLDHAEQWYHGLTRHLVHRPLPSPRMRLPGAH